jgi:hypothetical protein
MVSLRDTPGNLSESTLRADSFLVRVLVDEHTIVFVLKLKDTDPDPYTSTYFELAGVFPEKFVFEPQDTVPEQFIGGFAADTWKSQAISEYRGGGAGTTTRRRMHSPTSAPWLQRIQQSFLIPYDTFVYLVENNPLALVLKNLRSANITTTPSMAAEPVGSATPITSSPITSSPIVAAQGTEGTEGAEPGHKTIVLSFRRIRVILPEEEGKSLPDIIEHRPKGAIDTNAQGLTYPELEQMCRLQAFLHQPVQQSDVWKVNGKYIAFLPSDPDPSTDASKTVRDLDTSKLTYTWVHKLLAQENSINNTNES